MGVGLAEEDMCAHSHAFASLEYDIVYDLPKYRAWLDERDLRDVYREHRLWMQMTAWCRRRAGKPAERWCFKLPWHVRSLSTLLETYPDALIVHTHRPVKEVTGSRRSLEMPRTLKPTPHPHPRILTPPPPLTWPVLGGGLLVLSRREAAPTDACG